MSFWANLAKIGLVGAAPFTGGATLAGLPLVDAIGKATGSAADSMAKNRGTALDASLTKDALATSRGAEDRASLGDAWKRLQQAQYVQNNTQGYTPPTLHTSQGDRTLDNFSFAPQASTPAEMQGAAGMQGEVMRRLTGGSQLAPLTDVTKMSKPSTWEKILGIISPIATAAGSIYKAKQGDGEDGK